MKQFITYEYKEFAAGDKTASLLIDGYENFGWIPDENGVQKHLVRLKRDRKIVNKMELTRLQRNFEACVREIHILKASKTSKASMCALIVGIIGTAFMAGSVFAVTAEPPRVLLCIFLAVPAWIGWICPYFLYKKIAVWESERLERLIEAKYDEIYSLCEKGNKLLNHQQIDFTNG